ncbi:MAG: IS481 family transposase [Gammaproteobacteria bacterium]|nr:MAG: IS481 family transposase [Gammaproteobacteria bacterium]
MPRARKDKGNYRALDDQICQDIINERQISPGITVPMIIKRLKQKKVISTNENLRLTSIYRFLKQEKLGRLNTTAEDKRKFEAEYPNQIWQSDIMHGPKARVNGINKKTYLHAIIDDHSRLIIHAEFYVSERLEAFKDCLKQSLQKRGLPQKLYVDNGACYSAINLEQITACLGIGLTHSRPYTPQGRGKIERWFKTVRECFLPLHPLTLTLQEFNLKLDDWVDEYNNMEHSSIKMRPFDKYRKNLECIRPAPERLMEYFRVIKYRKMNKDRTFRINKKIYEGPTVLIDRQVELRYHQDEPDEIEVFFNGQSFGKSSLLNAHLNSKIGRDYKNKSGELFKSDKKGDRK